MLRFEVTNPCLGMQALGAALEREVGRLSALDMFHLLSCMHGHRAHSHRLYTACAAALAPKLGDLQCV